MFGTMQPIHGAAVAHDGRKTLVMLRHRTGESVPDLLSRLDAVIGTAQATDQRVDEINQKSSATRYEL